MPIVMDSPSFQLARDLVNDRYSTDLSGLAKTYLIENLVANGVETNLGNLTTNSSGATFVRDTGKIWVIHNGTSIIDEYDPSDLTTVIRTVALGGSLTDTEGVEWMGYNADDDMYEFAVASENGGNYYVIIFQITLAQLTSTAAGQTFDPTQTLTVAPAEPDGNKGAEGVAFDRFNNIFYVVGEGSLTTPRELFSFTRPADRVTTPLTYVSDFTVTDHDAETLFDSWGTHGDLFDLSDIHFHEGTGHLIILSHTGTEIVQLNLTTGTIVSNFPLSGNQWEGICLVGDDVIVIAEAYEYQLYDYVAP